MVAGLDGEDMEAAKIKPVDPDSPETPADGGEQESEQENIFTDEESDKLYELMARFKKVEPQYLELIENVVKMAESGDNMYAMAKNFLLK